MDRRRGGTLSDSGQALAELPATLVVLVCLSLLLVQLALFSLTSTVVSQAAREAARVASTARDDDDALVNAFVGTRLEVLGKVPALMVPGSLVVSRSGTPRSALVSVTVEVMQTPLPIVGWLVAGGRSTRAVRVTAQAPGGEAWVRPDAPVGEVVYGAEQQPKE